MSGYFWAFNRPTWMGIHSKKKLKETHIPVKHWWRAYFMCAVQPIGLNGQHCYAPPLIGGDIKRWCCLTSVCLTSVLSVAYIGPKSRTERPMNTKIGTEVAHLTRDSDTFKGQRSRSPGRFSHRGVYASRSCSGERENVFTVGIYRNVAVRRGRLGGARRFGAHRGRRGAGHIVAAARLQLVYGATPVQR